MTIIDLIKSNRLRASLLIFFNIIIALSTVGGEYIFQFAITALSKGQFEVYLKWQIVVLILILVTTFLTPYLTQKYNVHVQDYIYKLRNRVLNAVYRGQKDSVGSLETVLYSNMDNLQKNYAQAAHTIFGGIIILTFSIIAMISMNVILLLATLLLVVINLFLPNIRTKKTQKASDEVAKATDNLFTVISQWFSGLEILRRYKAKDKLVDIIENASSNLESANVSSTKQIGISRIINGFGNTFSQLAITAVAAILYFLGYIEIGSIIAAGGLANSIFNSVTNISGALISLKSTKLINNKLIEIINYADNKKPLQKDLIVESITFKNVSVVPSVNEKVGFPDFNIQRGDKVLVRGMSGVGKSTLLKTLIGTIKPDSGAILIRNNQNAEKYLNPATYNYLTQDIAIFPGTIGENITMFTSQDSDKLEKALTISGLNKDLREIPDGLDYQIDIENLNLSGGQIQKIALARVLYSDRQIFILDEPTSAIDDSTTEFIFDKLSKLENKTVIIVAHNLTDKIRECFDYEINLVGKV